MPASQAAEQLKFQLEKTDGLFVVRIKNPSPYHVTFRSLQLRQSPDSEVLAELEQKQERMVSPEGELLLQLTSPHQEIAPDVRLFFSIVNDYGGENQAEQSLQRADRL